MLVKFFWEEQLSKIGKKTSFSPIQLLLPPEEFKLDYAQILDSSYMNVKKCRQKCHFKPQNVAIFAKNDKKNRLKNSKMSKK